MTLEPIIDFTAPLISPRDPQMDTTSFTFNFMSNALVKNSIKYNQIN